MFVSHYLQIFKESRCGRDVNKCSVTNIVGSNITMLGKRVSHEKMQCFDKLILKIKYFPIVESLQIKAVHLSVE